MPLLFAGVIACEKCGRSMRVLWPTRYAPWESVTVDGVGSLKGWRFGYVNANYDNEGQALCPDHAIDAPPELLLHA